MVGPKWLKLGGLVEHMRETSSQRDFLDLPLNTRIRSMAHTSLQVHGDGDEVETRLKKRKDGKAL